MRPPSRSCPRTPARLRSAVGVRLCAVALSTVPRPGSYLYRLEATRYVAAVGRGLGPTQQAILGALASTRRLTIAELAQTTGRDPRQVRAAVEALERRGLVRTERTAIAYREDGMPISGLYVSRVSVSE